MDFISSPKTTEQTLNLSHPATLNRIRMDGGMEGCRDGWRDGCRDVGMDGGMDAAQNKASKLNIYDWHSATVCCVT